MTLPNDDKPAIVLAFANDFSDHAKHLRNLPQEQREIVRALERGQQLGLCKVVLLPNVSKQVFHGVTG